MLFPALSGSSKMRGLVRLLPLSRSAFYEAMKSGRLKYHKVEGTRCINFADLQRFALGEPNAE
jgi:hypothetical protein